MPRRCSFFKRSPLPPRNDFLSSVESNTPPSWNDLSSARYHELAYPFSFPLSEPAVACSFSWLSVDQLPATRRRATYQPFQLQIADLYRLVISSSCSLLYTSPAGSPVISNSSIRLSQNCNSTLYRRCVRDQHILLAKSSNGRLSTHLLWSNHLDLVSLGRFILVATTAHESNYLRHS